MFKLQADIKMNLNKLKRWKIKKLHETEFNIPLTPVLRLVIKFCLKSPRIKSMFSKTNM